MLPYPLWLEPCIYVCVLCVWHMCACVCMCAQVAMSNIAVFAIIASEMGKSEVCCA